MEIGQGNLSAFRGVFRFRKNGVLDVLSARMPAYRPNRPVVNVGWHDAEAYSKWAGVCLLTEAQWERAARGQEGRRYPWSKEERIRSGPITTKLKSTLPRRPAVSQGSDAGWDL